MTRRAAIAEHLAAHSDADPPPVTFGAVALPVTLGSQEMPRPLSQDPNDGRMAVVASQRYINSDGLESILAACVRQAIRDYRTGYVGYRLPDAATFLRSAGILTDEGLIDSHGHRIPAPKAPRRSPRAHKETV